MHKNDFQNAFFLSYKISEVILPNSLEIIEEDAFSYTGIETIDIPSTVREIGDGAFSFSSLKEIIIPEGVVHIGEGVFRGCSDLTSITLPSTLETFSLNCFWDCNSLREIHLAGDYSGLEKFYGIIPEDCKIYINGETLTVDESGAYVPVTPDQMEYRRMYVLKSDKTIAPIEPVHLRVTSQEYPNIPVVEAGEKIIVKAVDDYSAWFKKIEFTDIFYNYARKIELSNNKWRFYDGNTWGEVDTINGVELSADFPSIVTTPQLAIRNTTRTSNEYYLFSIGEPEVFHVGYWRGTDYLEMDVLTDEKHYWDDEESIECDYIRTYDGYAIVDTEALDSGYYSTEGFRKNGIIYLE